MLTTTFFCLLLVCIEIQCADDEGPQVQVTQGILRGKYGISRSGRKFNTFLSIPYAEPPVGDLRFQPPVIGKSWKGVRDATKPHGICPQKNLVTRSDVIAGDEDCLYLNVYTPKMPISDSDSLPVMVYLHGGGWVCGSGGPAFHGPDFLLDHEVVLVGLNYRLGPLGFLTTGDEVVPGNNGLKDQALAIKWVKNNIAAFGGDPNSITIFGESGGGTSVHFQMLSPLNKGMLKAAISQSGTAICPFALMHGDEGVQNAKRLAELFNCPTESSRDMVDCLRKISANDIIAQDKVFLKWDIDPISSFRPVIEPNVKGAFLSEHPVDIIKSGNFEQIPWVTGIVRNEGAFRPAAFVQNPHQFSELNTNFNEIMPISLLYDQTAPDPKEISEQIRKFYFGDQEINTAAIDKLSELYTDSWFLSGNNEAIRLHKTYGKHPVYNYLFDHRGVSSYSALFGDPRGDYGVCHGDELLYLFPNAAVQFPNNIPSEGDNKMTEIMTNLWANIAKKGNPTPETDSVIPNKWEPVGTENLEYYQIGGDGSFQMRQNLFEDRDRFWRHLKFKNRREFKDEL